MVKAILAAGPHGRHPSIRDVNKHGLTPLGEALVAGRCDVADLLVSQASACFCALTTADTGLGHGEGHCSPRHMFFEHQAVLV